MAKKSILKPKKLKGFRDYQPAQAKLRREIINTLTDNALMAGFQQISTPALEYSETLLGSGGQETDKEVYRFTDHGGREVAMRFDLTVPFARFVAENQGTMVMPFKKLQIGDVWRGEKPQKGRYREFCQGDLDIVGVDSLAADVEVISCLASVLDSLIPTSFTVSLGHRVLLSSIIKVALPRLAKEDEVAVLIALDKIAKIGVDKVAELIGALPNVESNEVSELLSVLDARVESGDSDLEVIRKFLDKDEAGLVDLERFESTVEILRELVSESKGKIKVDLSIARGLGYYTGVVFETQIDSLNGFGSVSSGGRYNQLVSRFSSQEVPGVGGSIGVDRLLAALEELQEDTSSKKEGFFVAVAQEEARAYGFKIVSLLRKSGLKADIGLKPGKLANQFKYADKRNYSHVLVIGEDELKTQTVTVKDMETGAQNEGVSINEISNINTSK